jgi:hypothetical protein
MMPIIQINFLLKMEAGRNRVGSEQRKGREKERSGLRE